MNEQTGAAGIAESTDPTVDASKQRRRIDALQRALRARQVLEREAELAARYGRTVRDADAHGGDEGPDDATDPDEYERDVERLVEIHRALRHERRVARRPFHRHSERLVLALELAERLALERLGFDDYADFEAHRDDERPTREIIDLDHIERAQRELAEAEAILAELGAPRTDTVVVTLPTWTVDPVLRRAGHERPTRARRAIFGATDHARGRWSPPTDDEQIGARPLPSRLARVRAEGRRRGRCDDPAPAADRVLGEIVHDGRVLRVEKIGGLSYDDDDEGISYGDPTRSA